LASLEFLSKILTTVTQLGNPKEVTIEVNSESLREEHSLLFERGVTRFSVGLQSLNQDHLKTLGRKVDLESNYKAIELTNRWRTLYDLEVNFDLITSIPNQTVEEALDEINQLVKMAAPHHISLYNLTLEEGSELAQMRNLPFKEEQEEAILLFALWEELEALGYHQYEISNFAKEERYQSLHNSRYWSLEDYLGLGSSAVSLISNVTLSNESDLATYGKSEPFTTYLKEELTLVEMMESHLMMGLRTSKGVDKREWFKRYGLEFNVLFKDPIKALLKDERHLVKDDPSYFALTKEGFMLLDAIILYLVNFCH
jgi:oxygen-independent coproporphyrinogen-3 oxidase